MKFSVDWICVLQQPPTEAGTYPVKLFTGVEREAYPVGLGFAICVVAALALPAILENAHEVWKAARTRKKFKNWPWA